MADHDVHFLGPGRRLCRNGQDDVAQLLHLAAADSRHADDLHAFGPRFGNGRQDVAAVAGRRNADEDVAFVPQGLDLAAEYGFIAVIVGHGRQDGRIDGQGNRRKGPPFLLESADDFRCQVL